MGDREEAKRLRQQAQELLESAQCKEMRADEEDAAKRRAASFAEAALDDAASEAAAWVNGPHFDLGFGSGHISRNGMTHTVAAIIEKAREDGARRQRALIRQEAERAEDARDFTRWAMELT